ncbi:MAG TPA: hypothetical protein VN861_02215 [Candidatus Acidoferrales bacterium]|nr:hypothetical protein [Candidatus Acidoferrales bacterium]
MVNSGANRSIATTWLVGIVLICGIAGCEKPNPTSTAKKSLATDAVPVYVILEGPWAIVPDPDPDAANGKGYLAIAPDMPDHGAMYVQASNGVTLGPGQYTLHLKNVAESGTDSYTAFAPTVRLADVKNAEENSCYVRYAIHFPQPNSITEETGGISRVGTGARPWPVTPANAAATANMGNGEFKSSLAVTLQYKVSDLTSIQLVATPGGPDPIPAQNCNPRPTNLPNPAGDPTGAIFPLPITLGNPGIIRVGSEPSSEDLSTCYRPSKETFQALTKLLNISAAIDYRAYDPGCQQCDPQAPSSTTICPHLKSLDQLEKVRKFVESRKRSGNISKDIRAIEAAVSGKRVESGGQKELMLAVERVEDFLLSVNGKEPQTPEQKTALEEFKAFRIGFNLPHKDCKTPIIAPTVQ